MALAFEQQPSESDKAFAAFSMYLSLGPERSLAAAAKKLGKGQRILEKWSGRFDWPARVQAHNAHLALVEREAAEALARVKGVDWVKRQEEQLSGEWQARCEALELAREAIQRWKENPKKCGTLEGIARLLDLASKLGRLASGMPTDRTEVSTEVQGKIDVEWEIAIKRVYGQAEPVPAAVVDVEAKALAGGHQEGTDVGA
jgi:hypothetical protein